VKGLKNEDGCFHVDLRCRHYGTLRVSFIAEASVA